MSIDEPEVRASSSSETARVPSARIERVPEFHDVTCRSDVSGPGGMDAFHPVLQTLLRSGRLASIVRSALEDARTGEGLARVAHALGGRSDRALPLHVTGRLKVYAAPVDMPERTVSFIETRVMNEVVAVLGGGAVYLRVFDIAESWPVPRLANGRSVTLHVDESVAIDARTQTYSVEGTDGPSLLLLANSEEVTDVARRYDATTLEYQQTVASSQDSARLRFALQTFSMLPSPSAVEAVDVSLKHRATFIRWHAIDTLTALEPARALAEIEKAAASDPDPMMREAAAKTLERVRSTHVAVA